MASNQADPQVLQAMCAQALALHQAGRTVEAAAQYETVLRRNPKHADAQHLLGVLRMQSGDIDAAMPLLKGAVRAMPRHPNAHVHLGLALFKAGRMPEALAACETAIALKPDLASAQSGRGVVLGELGRHDEALASLDLAGSLAPNDPEIQFNRSVQLHHLRRHEEAVAALQRALTLNPRHAAAHHNLGTALAALGRTDEALVAYDAALAIQPDYAEAHSNRGLALASLQRHPAAMESFESALRLQPDYADARFNRSLTLMTLGDLGEGFREYVWRRAIPRFQEDRPVANVPLWAGEDLTGKAVVVRGEQGFGDCLHFVRYAGMLAKVAARVAVVAPPALVRLFRSMPGVEVVSETDGAGFDVQVFMMDLPIVFGTSLDTVPGQTPYLFADATKARDWAERLAAFARETKVGLVWAGDSRKHNPDANAIDRRRSLTLAQLAPLAAAPNVRFVSLQKGGPADQAATPPAGMRLVDWTDELKDFADTAALIAGLDVVITVDTSVAHLAGALGKPVWILSRFDACWRWLGHREDSPWYPTARLFYQRAPGAWDEVIARVASELSSWRP